MQVANTNIAPDMDEERFFEAVAHSLGEDYWEWRGNENGPSGRAGGKFQGNDNGRS
jgi:hypothetical protein